MRAVFPTNNGFGPTEGPKFLTVIPVFTTATVPLDFHEELAFEKIAFFQVVYIDNSANDDAVILTIDGMTQQSITCPGRHQGTFPLIGAGNKYTITCAVNARVTLLFGNVPMPLAVWSAGTTSTPPVAIPVIVTSQNAPVGISSVADVTLTNGVVTPLLPGSATRVSAIIVADPANTVDIRVGDPLVAANRGARVAPGQAITLTTQGNISGFASAAGQIVSITYTHN